jgi:hypothetical protein
VFLDDGSALQEKLGLYYALVALVDFDSRAIERAAAELAMPLTIVKLTQPGLKKIYERDFLLVRPDQHVAWRGDELPADFTTVLRHVSGN